jgi:hypothetical protein
MIWYKVRGSVELFENGFDSNTNKWAKKITYIVTPYTEPNVKHVYGPAAKPNGTVKEYNYLYTGENKDIIDLKLDFDMTFYTAVFVARERMAELGNKATATDPAGSLDKIKPSPAPGTVQPHNIVPVAVNQRAMATGDAQKDATSIILADIVQNIYSTARGDMINVMLRIIGDPEFIKQDDLYLNPLAGPFLIMHHNSRVRIETEIPSKAFIV